MPPCVCVYFALCRFAPSSASTEIPYWPAYTSTRPATYLIHNRLHVIEGYRESGSHFWTRYLPSIASKSHSASASIIHRPPSNGDDSWPQANSRNNYYDEHSVTMLKTFAWSMLALSVILASLVLVLLALLFYQRRKQSFSASDNGERARQTSAKALARALASSASSTSGLY